jgi:hypothetical protein
MLHNSDESISLSNIYEATKGNRAGAVPATYVLRPNRKIVKKESEIES